MNQDLLKHINERYLINAESIEAVTSEMFRCTSSEGIFYARVTKYRPYEAQLEEVNWTNFLADQGIGVSTAVSSVNGSPLEFLEDGKIITLYKAAKGIHLPRKEWQPEILEQLGAQIGKMHHHTKEYIKTTRIEHLGIWHEQEEFQFLKYIPAAEEKIREAAREVMEGIRQIPKREDTFGLIHSDIWLENTLVEGDASITVIDFQDSQMHFYLYDLAVPLYSALEFTFAGQGSITDYAQSLLGALLKGYRKEHELPAEMLEHLPLFLKLKELFEYNLMHMYWKQDNLTEDQIRIMNLYRLRLENRIPLLGNLEVKELCHGY